MVCQNQQAGLDVKAAPALLCSNASVERLPTLHSRRRRVDAPTQTPPMTPQVKPARLAEDVKSSPRASGSGMRSQPTTQPQPPTQTTQSMGEIDKGEEGQGLMNVKRPRTRLGLVQRCGYTRLTFLLWSLHFLFGITPLSTSLASPSLRRAL